MLTYFPVTDVSITLRQGSVHRLKSRSKVSHLPTAGRELNEILVGKERGLSISMSTVKTHVNNIFRKLNIKKRTEL